MGKIRKPILKRSALLVVAVVISIFLTHTLNSPSANRELAFSLRPIISYCRYLLKNREFRKEQEKIKSSLPAISANEVPFRNVNSQVAAKNYKQKHDRDLGSLTNFYFGHTLAADIKNLKAGDPILLPGGGFFLYGLELAKKGFKVTVINAQDFYGELIQPLAQKPGGDVLIEDHHVTYVGGIEAKTLTQLAMILNIPSPDCFHLISNYYWALKKETPHSQVSHDLGVFAQTILQQLEVLESSHNLEKITGLVQDKLPAMPIQAKLIIDLYDAFFYSSERVNLLNLYYSKLAEGGKAYLYVTGINDSVINSKGRETNLFLYLLDRFPKNFEVVKYLDEVGNPTAHARTIVLKRNPGEKFPFLFDENLLKITQSSNYESSYGFVVPTDKYKETITH